jgi:hypothetical protein
MDIAEYKKCSSCKTKIFFTEFKFFKDKYLLCCNDCLKKSKESREKTKCEHGRQKCRCKDCGGNSICSHGNRNIECALCDNASQRCIHKKLKIRCLDCVGSSICEHQKRKDTCRKCNSQTLNFTIKTILHCSKNCDVSKNKYDEFNFIDYDHVYELIIKSNFKCVYCFCDLIYNKHAPNMITIERIDVSKGHIKENCCISCLDCNIGKVQRNIVDNTTKIKCPCGFSFQDITSRKNRHLQTKIHKKYLENEIINLKEF